MIGPWAVIEIVGSVCLSSEPVGFHSLNLSFVQLLNEELVLLRAGFLARD